MAKTQKYGIKYPFSSENDENIFFDLNDNRTDEVTSKVLHVIFTPKGQKIRDPEFGTDLISYIYDPNDDESFESVKSEISRQVLRYVPNVELKNIEVYRNENNDGVGVMVEYGVKKGNQTEITKIGVKL
jgi:phage baseplate assembly protein W